MTNKIYYLAGKKTKLRLYQEGDEHLLIEGVNRHDIQETILLHKPMSIEQEVEWIKKVSQPDGKNLSLAVETMDGEFLGTMSLNNIDHMNGKASTGAMFVNKAQLGKGYGTDAKFALLHYAFCTLNMRKIYSGVLATNLRSKAYQEKNGYKHVGTRARHWYKNGEYVDECIMEVFKEDFLPLYEAYMKNN